MLDRLFDRFRPNPVTRRYELGEHIGMGGMGSVRRARDRVLGRMVAIKTITIPAGHAGSQRARFLQEARAASSLKHPNIITVFDFVEHGDRCSIIMELVDGKNLASLLEEGPLRPAEAISLVGVVAGAMERVHTAGILHRDLKPANIHVQPDGSPKILDFGLAAFRMRPGQDAGLTRVGEVVGTPAYMSPEQIRGDLVDQRTDVFALGCVLYEALTGQRPFRGKTLTAVLTRIVTETPPPPSQLNADLGEALDALVARALEKDPTARFQGMGAFGKAMEAARVGLPHSADGPPALLELLAGTSATTPRDILEMPTQVTSVPMSGARRIVAAVLLLLLTTVGLWWILSWGQGRLAGGTAAIPVRAATVTLAGTVRGPDGPVEGARVTVDGYPFEAFSSSLGQFGDPVPDAVVGDRVRLRVSHPRFQTRTVDIRLGDGFTDSITVVLIPVGKP